MRFAASTRKLAPIYAQNNTRTTDDKSHAAIPMRSATRDSKTPYNYARTSTPKAASSHRDTAAKKLDDGWPESEKDVFQAALRMVVVKDSRWIVGEFYMSYGRIWCEKVRLIKKRILGKGHQMTRVLQPQRERGRRERERRKGIHSHWKWQFVHEEVTVEMWTWCNYKHACTYKHACNHKHDVTFQWQTR